MSTIVLDITPEQRRNQIIINCGAKPIGEMPEIPNAESLCCFVDPITKSTCFLQEEEVTEENVRAKLAAKRKEFGMDYAEQAIKNNAGIRKQIRGAIRLITNNKLPEEILNRAADAAFYEIIQFEAVPAEIIEEQLNTSDGAESHAA